MKRPIGAVLTVVGMLATAVEAQTFIVEALGQNSENYHEVSGTWATSQSRSTVGRTPDRNSRYASVARAVATWTFVPSASGVYDAYVTLPSTTNVTASQVTYTVTSDGAPLVVNVNQNNGGGANNVWFKLNSSPLTMSSGVAYAITQTETASPGGLPCQRADAVRWEVPYDPPPPRFRPGHTLPPLATWGPEMSYEMRKALADDWGYALQFGRLRGELVDDLQDPQSTVSRVCALATADPNKYPLHVITAPAFSVKYRDDFPPETWCRDQHGEHIVTDSGDKVWSPEAPAATSQMIAEYERQMLQAVLARAPIAVLTNGGEYGLGVYGWWGNYWGLDPEVVATKGTASWYEYISMSKARQEQLITDALRELVPQRQLYIFYTTAGAAHRNAIVNWSAWYWDYGLMRTISDLPNNSIYYEHHNDGFTGSLDMLTLMLNSVGQNLSYGDRLSYNWVSGGWLGADRPPMADPDRYEGYLKCCYMSGMIGAVAYVSGDPLDWLWQYKRLGKVHAFFSWLEPFVRASELLGGPNDQRWTPGQPAYEFPTGDENARVLARKRIDRDEWLIAAWAADGAARNVSITIPSLGAVAIEARPEATVYRAYLEQGQPVLLALRFAETGADFDNDGDVDLMDFTQFQLCFNGPNRPASGACATGADFDVDGDVDLADFATYQGCFNGPNRPPKCE